MMWDCISNMLSMVLVLRSPFFYLQGNGDWERSGDLPKGTVESVTDLNFKVCPPAPDPYPPDTTPGLLQEMGRRLMGNVLASNDQDTLGNGSSQFCCRPFPSDMNPWAEMTACQAIYSPARHTHGPEKGNVKKVGKQWTTEFPFQPTICKLDTYSQTVKISLIRTNFHLVSPPAPFDLCPHLIHPRQGEGREQTKCETWKAGVFPH